jgi:putative glycerol-1-phosphate prenyltransferase
VEVVGLKNIILQWKHVFKLDPDRDISDEDLEQICESGTHAIIVGGSTGITFDNTVDLLSRIRRYTVPCVLEVSSQDAIVPGFDLYFIPVVLNTDQARWMTGYHHQAIKEYGAKLPWDEILTEGYVMLNPQSTAAQITRARTGLDTKDVLSYARMAEKMFHLPIFYIEYSGMFGDMDIVKQTANILETTRLFYGGGIDSLDKAKEAAAAAHTIVVGNIIYENLKQALETVQIIEQMC